MKLVTLSGQQTLFIKYLSNIVDCHVDDDVFDEVSNRRSTTTVFFEKR